MFFNNADFGKSAFMFDAVHVICVPPRLAQLSRMGHGVG